MVTMICWLVIHTSNDALDNRSYQQFSGTIVKAGNESNMINFLKDFKKKHIDMNFNPAVQMVSDEECLYVESDHEKHP